jgi:hypothetical protein
MITRARHLRAKRDIVTIIVKQVNRSFFIGSDRSTDRWWQRCRGKSDMGGKVKWARAFALVALDCRRDGWIECAVLTCRIKAFNVGNLLDDISEMAWVDGILGGANVGDTALCTMEVDGKWRCIQGTKLSNLVHHVDNHFGLLNEGKTKDCVYGDVWSNCNKESGGSSLAHDVG